MTGRLQAGSEKRGKRPTRGLSSSSLEKGGGKKAVRNKKKPYMKFQGGPGFFLRPGGSRRCPGTQTFWDPPPRGVPPRAGSFRVFPLCLYQIGPKIFRLCRPFVLFWDIPPGGVSRVGRHPAPPPGSQKKRSLGDCATGGLSKSCGNFMRYDAISCGRFSAQKRGLFLQRKPPPLISDRVLKRTRVQITDPPLERSETSVLISDPPPSGA
jgi:hypothetical protein